MRPRFKNKLLFALAMMCAVGSAFSQTIPLVFDVENRGASCTKPTPKLQTSNKAFPDPFQWSSGTGRVSTCDEWSCRRNEIKTEVEYYEIGEKPNPPSNVTATYSGGTLTVKVTENGQTLTLTSSFTVPSGTGPFPVMIGMGGFGGIQDQLSGIIQLTFNHDQVVTYNAGSGSRNLSDPFYKLYPSLTASGKYCGWSWGVSRLIDGLAICKKAGTLNVDMTRIGVVGCSYAGKMALFSGAFDERIALTIAEESGGGGINSWRTSKEFNIRTGTNVEKIDNTNFSWFKQSMSSLDPYTLPYDHHELVAMVAPRAFLSLGNPDMVWLCDESGYKSLRAAHEVWKAFGVADRFGFDFEKGHNHCAATTVQKANAKKFIDKFLRGITTTNTDLTSNPFASIDYKSFITWTTPTITCAPADDDIPVPSITSPATNATFEAPASITLTATVKDAKNNVTKVEFLNGNTIIGSATTAPYTVTWNAVAEGTYIVTVRATDANNKVGTTTATVTVINTYKIYKTATAITIDGTADATWSNAVVTSLSASKLLTGTVTNAADLSGTIKALWDDTYLYVLADVNDESLKNDSQSAYDDDAVEVYVDINNDKATTYGTNDVQYTFGWNDGTTVGSLPSGRSTTGITYKAVAKTGGYVVEAAIPWTTLQKTPTADQYLGFDFMINDDDDGTARDAKLSWNSATDNAYQDPSLFGTAVLKAATCNLAAPTVSTSITYEQNTTAVPLTATGTGLLWYASASGGTGSATPPTPSTAVLGTISYYVSQSNGTCESSRAKIDVTTIPVSTTKVKLVAGWNFVGCPIAGTTAIESALSSIWPNVLVVKDLQSFYLNTNSSALNSLTSLTWGGGYMVKVSKACELTWTTK